MGFIPVKQEMMEAGGAEGWRDPPDWIGSRPRQITSIQPERITLVRNERYWGGQTKLDGIEYTIVADEQHALDAYTRGDLDVVYAKFDIIPRFEADPALSRELVAVPTLTTDVFQF